MLHIIIKPNSIQTYIVFSIYVNSKYKYLVVPKTSFPMMMSPSKYSLYKNKFYLYIYIMTEINKGVWVDENGTSHDEKTLKPIGLYGEFDWLVKMIKEKKTEILIQ